MRQAGVCLPACTAADTCLETGALGRASHHQAHFHGNPSRAMALTGEEQPELSSHVLWDALEHQIFGLLRTVHAHTLAIFCKVVLPRLLLQELLGLGEEIHGVL